MRSFECGSGPSCSVRSSRRLTSTIQHLTTVRDETNGGFSSVSVKLFRPASVTRSGPPPGHPRGDSELLEKVWGLLEERHLDWSQIAQNRHVPASSCRKWVSYAARAKAVTANGPVTRASPKGA